MDETQDQTDSAKTRTGKLPKGGVRLADLANKRARNLRDNLAKRKQQTRARKTPETEPLDVNPV